MTTRNLRHKRGWGGGAKALTWVGATIVFIAVVCGAFGAWSFVGILPTSIIDGEGRAGEEARGELEIPGSVEIRVDAGERIAFWEVVPVSESFALDGSAVTVTGPGGEVAVGHDAPSGSIENADHQARTFGQFRAAEAGTYTVEVDSTATGERSVVLAQGSSIPEFALGVFSTVTLWFLAIGGAMLGGALLLAGIIWGMVRARTRPGGLPTNSP